MLRQPSRQRDASTAHKSRQRHQEHSPQAAPWRSAAPEAAVSEVWPYTGTIHTRMHRSTVCSLRCAAKALRHTYRHAHKREARDTQMRSCANGGHAPRAAKTGNEERACLCLCAGTHLPPRSLRASRGSGGDQIVDRTRCLAVGAEHETDAHWEGAQELQQRTRPCSTSTNGSSVDVMVLFIKGARQSLVLNWNSTRTSSNCGRALSAHVSTLIVLCSLVDRLKIKQPAVGTSRVVTVREARHIAKTEVRNDTKATRSHSADGGSGQRSGKEAAWLKVASDATASDIAVDDAQNRVMMIIPTPPGKMSTGNLDAMRIIHTGLGRPIGNAAANMQAEGR